MIKLPNFFKGYNITFHILLDEGFDFTEMVEDIDSVPVSVRKQLNNISCFSITMSEMVSSINNKKTIKYIEVIVKLTIIYQEKEYIYPVVSYIDNKFSLIRGYYLGFHKQLDFEYSNKNNIINFNNHNNILLECDISKLNLIDIEKVGSISNKDLILFSNLNLHNSMSPWTLNISNYELNEWKSINLEKFEIGKLKNKKMFVDKIDISRDKFTLTGIKSLKI